MAVVLQKYSAPFDVYTQIAVKTPVDACNLTIDKLLGVSLNLDRRLFSGAS
jgi:hypothetical protein